MRYKAILKTQYRKDTSSVAQINWTRETEFFSHKKARRLADAFGQEQKLVTIYPVEGKQYPYQIVFWDIISEKQYNEIKGE